MSLWTSLEPASTTVDPGSSARVRLRLRNTGDVVDEYRFEPVGPVAPWTVVEPPTLRLYPGTTGTVELTFSPPRTPDATAGPNPYAVRITPTEHPEAVTVPEGNLTVTPFTEVRAELVPPVVKGRFRGRPRLAVDNLGNTKVTGSLSGSDNGDKLTYEMRPANVQIEPGRAAFVDTILRPRQIIWFGARQEQQYTLSLRRSGAQPVDTQGTYVQRGFLPRWLATAFGLLLALAIAFVMIWMAYAPKVASVARERPKEAGRGTLPPPPPTASPTPSASASPSPSAEKTEEPDGGGDEDPKPEHQKTAAEAVAEAAQLKPGRHICYRAYVADQGWQKPACDGADPVDTNVPLDRAPLIKAINIATSGTQGVHSVGSFALGGWKTPWSTAPDNQDLYIGSTDEGESPLQGYTIKVPDGSVCQVARVEVEDWRPLGCTKPGDWMYGGTDMTDEKTRGRRLLAFRFTV